jgi:hypothetical protein
LGGAVTINLPQGLCGDGIPESERQSPAQQIHMVLDFAAESFSRVARAIVALRGQSVIDHLKT